MVVLLLLLAILCLILVVYRIIKNRHYKAIARRMTSQGQRKGNSTFVKLEGNLTRPISGDTTKTSMVFWYDPKEEQKIHSDRL